MIRIQNFVMTRTVSRDIKEPLVIGSVLSLCFSLYAMFGSSGERDPVGFSQNLQDPFASAFTAKYFWHLMAFKMRSSSRPASLASLYPDYFLNNYTLPILGV